MNFGESPFKSGRPLWGGSHLSWFVCVIFCILVGLKPFGVKANHFEIMTNTQRFAERELAILSKSATDPDNRPIIEPFREEILALCEAFGNSGQSGGSAPYTATALSQAVKKLCLQEPICPITGIEDEWINVTHLGNGEVLFQNTRCSAVFKNGRAYYLDAITFKTQNGGTYHSNSVIMPDGSKLTSRQYIKSFPFTPKTFYIDVIEKEVERDNWEFYIKDAKQLKKVWKYYDKYVSPSTDLTD